MKILLDESLPVELKAELPGYEVYTVKDLGWRGKKNGELIRLMTESEFQVFITADKNLRYQQNLADVKIVILVLIAYRNRLDSYLPLMPKIREILETAQP